MSLKMNYMLQSHSIDVNAPLIYMWEIRDTDEVVGRYVGKANGGQKRPTQHYTRNVNKLLRGLPYKKGKSYRRVHYALADAARNGRTISLNYLCNVLADQNIFEVEMHYIRKYRCDEDDGIGLNGPGKTPRPYIQPVVEQRNPVTEESAQPDLEEFLEFVEDMYPGKFTIKPGVRRYSLYIDSKCRTRIVRAFQSGPAGAVHIKLAQTSQRLGETEYRWDGTEAQLQKFIGGELKLLGEQV